ncbi:MAG: excinuclease ABC subunit UvrA [Deltaproteobacteria bacterium]|nr:excinuclease ABC subunit UvrA [Deltaproteobacteria bacterium]MBW1927864.1 excinuclease ABC subunit UvrA [Deltaproteobacteria bacterium]
MGSRAIRLYELRQNNLKGFDLSLPFHKVIAITGVSGSGKSSLALDTLYAEGQRRYVETFSAYARQFLERMPRPKVRRIENIPPAIAIEQVNPVKNSRSTVGTLTEINHFIKMLFYREATPYCPNCGRPIIVSTPQQAARDLMDKALDRAVVVTAPVRVKKDFRFLVEGLVQAGYYRVWEKGRIQPLQELSEREMVEVVIDRLKLNMHSEGRLLDSLERAFALGRGEVMIYEGQDVVEKYSAEHGCPYCGTVLSPRNPNLFSFNSPVGACPECHGFGRVIDIDWDLVVPNPKLSIKEGAVKVFEAPAAWEEREDLLRFCRGQGIPLGKPWETLPQEAKQSILFGKGHWYGVKGFFDWLETKRYKAHVRIFLSRYRAYLTCPQCHGTRFTKEALIYKLDGCNIAKLYGLPIGDAFQFMEQLAGERFDVASRLLFQEIRRRLLYLCNVGLDYLTLDRQSRTLSGGEVARAMLTRALASSLVETLYILDEPSRGLHAWDVSRVVQTLRRLSNQKNTVCVVEHDPQIILSSDFVAELGPGAGERGGRLVFTGSPSDLLQKETITGSYLAGRSRPTHTLSQTQGPPESFIIIEGASENNLKDINVSIPKGRLTVITGVSGSGKSTLLELVLFRGATRQKGLPTERPGRCRQIKGLEDVQEVILVDQSPVGRTPRANPATYLKLYDGVRKALASTEEAREKGLSPSAFSFNVPGGRCEQCDGQGYERVEMQFLSDIYLPCPACHGTRFRPEILEVTYKGKSVADILNMTFREALSFFSDNGKWASMLEGPVKIGLGYLRLGQPIHTLSGGEAQRLKLAHFLFTSPKRNALILVDEPTVGLHLHDVDQLMDALQWLVRRGNTVVVVEHSLEVLERADWVIDLGPEGGERGGEVVFQGPTQDLVKTHRSATALCFRQYLEGRGQEGWIQESRVEQEAPEGIRIVGARHHNLKNLAIEIPRNQLVVITGVSGSGKSTLAFDIIFAEGQRRYVESLSTYARQFLRLYERPEADLIEGLPPTVAIEQLMSQAGPRSTVGTLTEIYHYLRLLYARVAEPYCISCGRKLSTEGLDEMVARLVRQLDGHKAVVLAPKVRRRKGFHRLVLQRARNMGYDQVRIDGDMVSLSQRIPELARYKEHTIEVVIGSEVVSPQRGADLRGLIKKAFTEGDREAIILVGGREIFVSERYFCPECNMGLPAPDPLLFSFNVRAGACPKCEGLGRRETGRICTYCAGSRLRKEALAYRVGGLSIAELSSLPADKALGFLNRCRFRGKDAEVAGPILDECRSRLVFLKELGLGYLSLDRSGDTLSGGEAQRIRLVCELGGNLTGACYVLDEPTIGLHPRDNARLIRSLRQLQKRGNTVIVVEHDEETLRAADWIVDLGPGGGEKGGEVVYAGRPKGLASCRQSATAMALANHERHTITSRDRATQAKKWCGIKGARARNLKNISVQFPLGALTCITGVSGSGKSSLLMEVIHANLTALSKGRRTALKHCEKITGYGDIKKVMVVDHSPIGRTPRSTPATYIGVMADIRGLMAGLPEARARGWKPGRFSFNVATGRCPACAGQGTLKVEMRFLPKVFVSCEQCGGARYNPDTLSVRYKGKNMAEILDMTFSEAKDFFSSVPRIRRALDVVNDLGLGYLRLGQASPTLSGGETQRIKLAKAFIRDASGGALYLLDEPTTGLHMTDIERLLRLFHLLVERGNTIVVIEHNVDIVKEADWVIDLGPEGGDEGGRLLFQGPPSELLTCTESYTAAFLRKFLSSEGQGRPGAMANEVAM